MRQECPRLASRDFARRSNRVSGRVAAAADAHMEKLLGLVTVMGLQQYIRQADPTFPSVVYTVNIAMRASVIAYLS